MVYFILLILLCFYGVQIYSIIQFQGSSSKGGVSEEKPMVSVLLAARNEEKLINRCLEALDNLEYDSNRIEILIGDDNSSDHTAELVTSFIDKKPNFQLFKVTENMGKARGKANVIAHLARKAKGEIFFITDVDVKVPKQWVKSIVSEFSENIGIVSGTTKCERGSRFATLQAIDWLHFMGYIKSFSNAGIACTAVGNNMAVRSKAYLETGGFEKLDFSITEDYRLFQAVTANGWKWKTLLSPETLGLASYIPSWKEMLQQRKRWLIGAKDLTPLWKLLLGLYALFTPALFILLMLDSTWGMMAWMLKFFIQVVFISMLVNKAKVKPFSLFDYLSYEIYVVVNTLVSVLFFILPIKAEWKGRQFSNNDLR